MCRRHTSQVWGGDNNYTETIGNMYKPDCHRRLSTMAKRRRTQWKSFRQKSRSLPRGFLAEMPRAWPPQQASASSRPTVFGFGRCRRCRGGLRLLSALPAERVHRCGRWVEGVTAETAVEKITAYSRRGSGPKFLLYCLPGADLFGYITGHQRAVSVSAPAVVLLG